MKILIKNALIISNGKKCETLKHILVNNGVIKKICKDICEDDLKRLDEVIDLNGKTVIPGLIDIGTRTSETGYENKDNIINLTRAGVKGGFTTLVTSSKNKPIVDNKTTVEYIYSKAKSVTDINLYPLGSITKGGKGIDVAEIGEMILAGVVAIADGGKAIEDSALLRNVMLYSKMFDITVITSGVQRKLSGNGLINEGYISTKLGLCGIPKEAEEIEISKNIILAKYTGAKIHIPYVTTKGGLEIIKNAKRDGVNVTCSTTPHYFTLTDESVNNYDTRAKVMPPLREQEDVEAIKDGIIDGTIDCIICAHSPVSYEDKNAEFERASFGMPTIETAFSISYTNLVKNGNLSIEDLTILLSKMQAKILNLKSKGEIEVGFDADMTVIDENSKYVIDSSKFDTGAGCSPYDGTEVYGSVLMTIVGGKILYNSSDERVLAEID